MAQAKSGFSPNMGLMLNALEHMKQWLEETAVYLQECAKLPSPHLEDRFSWIRGLWANLELQPWMLFREGGCQLAPHPTISSLQCCRFLVIVFSTKASYEKQSQQILSKYSFCSWILNTSPCYEMFSLHIPKSPPPPPPSSPHTPETMPLLPGQVQHLWVWIVTSWEPTRTHWGGRNKTGEKRLGRWRGVGEWKWELRDISPKPNSHSPP